MRRWGPIAAVAIAAVVTAALVVWSGPDEPAPDEPLPPIEVTSDAPRVGSLEELLAASDLVVRASVVGTDRGRVFGEGDAAIESRVVQLRVLGVLKGDGALAGGGTVLVEEEGWSADGAPLIVDGLAPSQVGDDAIWFLLRVGQDEELRYVVVSAQGRYLVRGDRLEGAAGDDPLIAELVALGPAGLEVAAAASP